MRRTTPRSRAQAPAPANSRTPSRPSPSRLVAESTVAEPTVAESTAAESTAAESSGDDSTAGDDSTTGDEPEPILELMAITDPSWDIVDFQLGSFYFGPDYQDYNSIRQQTLPAPEHSYHESLGISPGEPHDGPYDHELSDNWAAAGFDSGKFTYPLAETQAPYFVMTNWMVVPGEGAPTGKTPDSEDGPMIPSTLFPIHFAVDYSVDGDLAEDLSGTFGVPALDMNLDSPFDVEGHSHSPMYASLFTDDKFFYPDHLDGTIFSSHVTTMVDVTGNGWDIKYGMKVIR